MYGSSIPFEDLKKTMKNFRIVGLSRDLNTLLQECEDRRVIHSMWDLCYDPEWDYQYFEEIFCFLFQDKVRKMGIAPVIIYYTTRYYSSKYHNVHKCRNKSFVGLVAVYVSGLRCLNLLAMLLDITLTLNILHTNILTVHPNIFIVGVCTLLRVLSNHLHRDHCITTQQTNRESPTSQKLPNYKKSQKFRAMS